MFLKKNHSTFCLVLGLFVSIASADIPRSIAEQQAPDAFTSRVEELIGSLSDTPSTAVLARAEMLSTAELERLKLEIAVSPDTGLELLEELAGETPVTTYPAPGCREPIYLPVFDYPRAARNSAFRLKSELAREAFVVRVRKGDFAWLEELTAGDADYELNAALSLIREGDTELAEQALTLSPTSRIGSELLVEAWLKLALVPEPQEFSLVHSAAGLRYLQEAARSPAMDRAALFAAGSAHPELASVSTVLIGSPADFTARRFLEVAGASAASVLSSSPGAIPELGAILQDPSASAKLHRHAALALLFNGEAEARVTLIHAIQSGALDGGLQAELERWLAE